jgi:hypothetical protein
VLHGLNNVVGDRPDVDLRSAAADEQKVGEQRPASQIEKHHVASVLGIGRPNQSPDLLL